MKCLILLVLCLPAFAEETPYVGTVISWKFKDAPGMSTRGGAITEFPTTATDRDGNVRTGGKPTQAEIDQWTAEYQAFKTANPEIKNADDVSWLKWAVNTLAPGVAGAGAAAVVLSASKRKDVPKDDPSVSPVVIDAEEPKPL